MNLSAVFALLRNPWVLVIVVSVIGIGGTGWYRMEWKSEVVAFGAYRYEEAKAVAAAQEKASRLSDELIIAQAASMAVTEKTVTVYRDRIAHAPQTNSCGPVLRDAARGVLDTLQPVSGQPEAGSGAAPAMRAAPRGR